MRLDGGHFENVRAASRLFCSNAGLPAYPHHHSYFMGAILTILCSTSKAWLALLFGDCYLSPTMAIARWATNWHIEYLPPTTAIARWARWTTNWYKLVEYLSPNPKVFYDGMSDI